MCLFLFPFLFLFLGLARDRSPSKDLGGECWLMRSIQTTNEDGIRTAKGRKSGGKAVALRQSRQSLRKCACPPKRYLKPFLPSFLPSIQQPSSRHPPLTRALDHSRRSDTNAIGPFAPDGELYTVRRAPGRRYRRRFESARTGKLLRGIGFTGSGATC